METFKSFALLYSVFRAYRPLITASFGGVRELVLMAVRVHPFPSRTRKLSSLAPKILGPQGPGKIGRCQHKSTQSFDCVLFIFCTNLNQHPERSEHAVCKTGLHPYSRGARKNLRAHPRYSSIFSTAAPTPRSLYLAPRALAGVSHPSHGS